MTLAGSFLLPFAFFFIIFFTALWYVLQIRRPKNFPPGPEWLPVVGNLPTLKKLAIESGGLHIAFERLAAEYGSDTIGIKLGGSLTAFVMGYRVVHQVLTSEEFEGRPDNFFIRLRCLGGRNGVTCVDGPFWQEQRSFVHRHLRSLGFGKKTVEVMVLDEINSIMEILDKNTDNVALEPLIAPSILNVLWTLTAGTSLSRTDPRLTKFLDLLHSRSKAFDMAGGTLNQLPWLRYIIPERVGYNLLVQLNNNLKSYFIGLIQDHKNNWSPDKQDDIMYSFLTEMKNNKSSSKNFTDEQLIMICLDLFFAGSTTTSTTLDFIFLQMLLHPDIQEKAAKCLHDAIPSNENITYADRLRLPYIEAIILESSRMYAVTPIIGPRRVMRDTVLDGYHIPKDTTIFINTHSVHYEKDYWGDPHVFRPERFIDEEGKLTYAEHVLNFGLGRRRCLGELLARPCVFLIFAALVRKYKICPVLGTEMPSSTPIPGITISPMKYKVRLEKR